MRVDDCSRQSNIDGASDRGPAPPGLPDGRAGTMLAGRPGTRGRAAASVLVLIRAMREGEYPDVLALWQRAGLTSVRPDGRDHPDAVREQLRSGLQALLVLEEDGELTGAVVATHDGRKGWINRLSVLPHLRRAGRGRLLLAAAEDWLRAQGLTVLAALVEEDNAPSLELFASAGYDLTDQLRYASKRDEPGS